MELLPDPQGDVKVIQLLRTINHNFPPKTSWKHIPHSYCYVCSKLDPDGRYMGNPYKYVFGRGYLQRCEHIPPAPHPTILGDSRPNTTSSDDRKVFDRQILNKDSLPGGNSTRFKMAPMFDKGELRDETGRFLPLVSENTFQTTNRRRPEAKRSKGDGRFSLPGLSNGKPSLVSSRNSYQGSEKSLTRSREEDEIGSRGGSFGGDRSHRGDENSSGFRGPKSDQKVKKNIQAQFPQRSGGAPWVDDEESEGVIKYQHRQKKDLVKMVGSSNSIDDYTNPSPNYPRSSKPNERVSDTNRSGTHNDSPSGTLSLSGRSSESSPDFVFSRMKSASWCECPDVEAGFLRCRECFKTGGHEKWCVSKLGICPKCNKPVRRKHNRLRRQGTYSPSQSMAKNITDLSTDSNRHNRDDCSSRKADDHRVRFHGSESNSFVKDKNKKRGGILKQDRESKFSFTEDENIAKRLKRAEESVMSTVPRVNPNVHRRAYMLALSDARVRKLNKDPWALENAFKRRYFSYFPLYKRPGFKPTTDVGIRTDGDLRRGKKVKMKKGMKHIFGDIDVSDYYPKVKNMSTADKSVT